MSECTLTKHGYTQVIEEDIDFVKRNIPENLNGHPCVKHIEDVLKKSIELLYPEDNPNSTTMSGYVARDKFQGFLSLFTKKPYRSDEQSLGIWKYDSGSCMSLPERAFKGLKWEDEPVEVDISITQKHKNDETGED